MAKQLLKSASANAFLGKTSDVLECYGYHTSENGAFFSSPGVAVAGSLQQNHLHLCRCLALKEMTL